MDNPQFLQHFYDLADADAQVRAKASVGLVSDLEKASKKVADASKKTEEASRKAKSVLGDACFEDLEYALERLIRGLASSRGSSRQGFSLALKETIKYFSGIIPIDGVFKLINKHLAEGGLAGSRDHSLGRFFAYIALIESDVYTAEGKAFQCENERVRAIKDVSKGLYELFESKLYLKEACTQAAIKLVKELCQADKRDAVNEIFSIWKIGDDGEIKDVNTVGFVLTARKLATEKDIFWPHHMKKPLTAKRMASLCGPLFQALQPSHHETNFPWMYPLLCSTLKDMAKTENIEKHLQLLLKGIEAHCFQPKAPVAATENGIRCLVLLCAYGPQEAFCAVMNSDVAKHWITLLKSAKASLLQTAQNAVNRLRAICGASGPDNKSKPTDWAYGVDLSKEPPIDDEKCLQMWHRISSLPDFHHLKKALKASFFDICLSRVSSSAIDVLALETLKKPIMDAESLQRIALHPAASDKTISACLCAMFLRSFCKPRDTESISLQEFCGHDVAICTREKMTDAILTQWRSLFWSLLTHLSGRTCYESRQLDTENKDQTRHFQGVMKDKKPWTKLMLQWWDHVASEGWKLYSDVRAEGGKKLRQDALESKTKGIKGRHQIVLRQLISALALGALGNENGSTLFAEIHSHWAPCGEKGDWTPVLNLLPALFINSTSLVREVVRIVWRDYAVATVSRDVIMDLVSDLHAKKMLSAAEEEDDGEDDEDAGGDESGTDSDDVASGDEELDPLAGQTVTNSSVDDILVKGEDELRNFLLDDTDELSKMAKVWNASALGGGDEEIEKVSKKQRRNARMQASITQKLMILELLELYITQNLNGQNPILHEMVIEMFACYHRHHYLSHKDSLYGETVKTLQQDLSRKIGATVTKIVFKSLLKEDSVLVEKADEKARAIFSVVLSSARHPIVSKVNALLFYWLLHSHERQTKSTTLTEELLRDAWTNWGKRDDGALYESIIQLFIERDAPKVLALPLASLIRAVERPFAQEQMLTLVTKLMRRFKEASKGFTWKEIAGLCNDLLVKPIENTKAKEKFRTAVLKCLVDALRGSADSLTDLSNLNAVRDSCPHKKGPVYNMANDALNLAGKAGATGSSKENRKKRDRDSNRNSAASTATVAPVDECARNSSTTTTTASSSSMPTKRLKIDKNKEEGQKEGGSSTSEGTSASSTTADGFEQDPVQMGRKEEGKKSKKDRIETQQKGGVEHKQQLPAHKKRRREEEEECEDNKENIEKGNTNAKVGEQDAASSSAPAMKKKKNKKKKKNPAQEEKENIEKNTGGKLKVEEQDVASSTSAMKKKKKKKNRAQKETAPSSSS